MDTGCLRLHRLLRELGDSSADNVDAVLCRGRERRELIHRLLSRWERLRVVSVSHSDVELGNGTKSGEDTTTANLLRRAATAGVCASNAQAALEGTARPSESLAIPLVLAELVRAAESERSESAPGRAGTTAAGLVRRGGVASSDATLLELIAEESLSELFSTHCSLFPPDITAAIRSTGSGPNDAAAGSALDVTSALEAETAALRRQQHLQVVPGGPVVATTDTTKATESGHDDGSGATTDVANFEAVSEHHLRTVSVFLQTVAQQADDVIRLCEARLSFSDAPSAAPAETRPIKASVSDAAAALAELKDVLASVVSVAVEIEAIEARRAPTTFPLKRTAQGRTVNPNAS